MADETLNPKFLVLPKYTEAVRDTLVAEVGTIIYNLDDDEINICKTAAAGAASWIEITSA